MADKPLTQKQIKEIKEKQREKLRDTVLITNKSKQTIPIHVKAAAGIDFYIGEQSVHLTPGDKYEFPTSRLYNTQINRLQKKRMINVMKIDRTNEKPTKKLRTKAPKPIRRDTNQEID